MKKIIFIIMVLFSVLLVSCTNNNMVSLSQMQIREMTTKEISADYRTTYKSTMTILQDEGYIIENANYDSGFILADKEIDLEKSIGDVFTKIFIDSKYKKSVKVKVSATVNEINGNTTKLRINLQKKNIEKREIRDYENTIYIQDKIVYDKLFQKIIVETERMKAIY